METNYSHVRDAARAYLFAWGRPLDQARYRYYFEQGDTQAVIAVLQAFQNDDGGFGHGLEPDIRTPASSVIATIHGLEILLEIHAADDEPLVQQAVAYLPANYDETQQVWPMVSARVEDAPHAPWWTYADTATSFDGFRINPTSAVVAHLLHRVQLLPQRAWLDELLEIVVERVAAKGAAMDMHELPTVLSLHANPRLPQALGEKLDETLTAAIPAVVTQEPDAWATYTLQPLDVAPTPDAFAARLLPAELLARNLDHWLATQLPDGSWPIPWDWAFIDAEAWAQAERDWKGFQIVQRLRTLAAYGH